MEIMTDTDTNPPREGVDKLAVLVVLERVRTILTNTSQGWTRDELWPDQDTPYPGHGPCCLTGAVAVAAGFSRYQRDTVQTLLDEHPAVVALWRTIRTLYPDFPGLPPGSYSTAENVAAWNDNRSSLRDVLAVVDATIARVGAE